MIIILIILAVTVLLLVLVGLILNLYLHEHNELQGAQQNRKKTPTTRLHDLIFQRKEYPTPLEQDD